MAQTSSHPTASPSLYEPLRHAHVVLEPGVRSPDPLFVAPVPEAESVEPGLLVSFDVDAVDQAWAPGVSAPATGGLTVELWLAAAREAGRSPRVRSIDIVEVSPPLDRDDQTSRLAALTIWTFLQGLAERRESS